MIKFTKKAFSILVLILMMLSSSLEGHQMKGLARLKGRVMDEEGSAIFKATVHLKYLVPQGQRKDEFEKTLITDKKGIWKIIGLGSGWFRITVSAPGYEEDSKKIHASQLEPNPIILFRLKKAEETSTTISQDKESMDALEQGNTFFEEGKYNEAISSYIFFLEKNPDAHQIHFNIGNCYKKKGDFEQAQKEFEQVIQKAKKEESPESKRLEAKALAAIGEIFLQKDNMESAKNYFKQSLELDPQDEILAYNVGEIYFSNGELDESIEFFSLASRIKPSWPDAYIKLGYVYLNKTDYENALKNFNKFLELDPDHPQAQTIKGILDYIK